MTLKELVDVLSKPETKLDVYGPQERRLTEGLRTAFCDIPPSWPAR